MSDNLTNVRPYKPESTLRRMLYAAEVATRPHPEQMDYIAAVGLADALLDGIGCILRHPINPGHDVAAIRNLIRRYGPTFKGYIGEKYNDADYMPWPQRLEAMENFQWGDDDQ